MERVRDVVTERELEQALAEPEAVILKHGARCGISASAREELEHFADGHPGVPLYRLEVGAHRDLAEALADRTGVAHQSPQAFVVREGRPVWHGSHFDITARALADALG